MTNQSIIPAQWSATEVQEYQQQQQRSPKMIVETATEQANVLMSIVEQKKLYASYSGKKFLFLEAWQLIGHFNGASPVVQYTKEIVENDKLVGYQACVAILRNGETLSSAESMAYLDDSVARGRQSDHAKRQAAFSMAQTRAASKAYRLTFSHVAILAGFEATPAEEMEPDDRPAPGRPISNAGYVPISQQPHPIERQQVVRSQPASGSRGEFVSLAQLRTINEERLRMGLTVEELERFVQLSYGSENNTKALRTISATEAADLILTAMGSTPDVIRAIINASAEDLAATGDEDEEVGEA